MIKRIVLQVLLLTLVLTPAAAQEQASINFRNADINSLIETVSQITGRVFVVDPRVRGNVTIIASGTIDADMFYQAFLSALQVQGFQAVQDGAVVRIVPINQAFGLLGDGGDNEIETRLIEVDYVDAVALVPVLRPVLSANARIQAFAETNYLIISDVASNVEAVAGMVDELDDPSEAEIEIIDLEYIPAGEAVYIISQLQQAQQQGLSIVEDRRNNRIMVSGPSAVRASLRNMLRTLDVPSRDSAGVEVIYLNYARAVDMQPILEGLLESSTFLRAAGESEVSAEGQGAVAGGFRVEVDESNNALVVAATPGVLREIRRIVSQLDVLKPQVLIEAVIAEVSEAQAARLSSQMLYVDQENGGFLTQFDSLLLTLLGVGTGELEADGGATQVLRQLEGIVAGGGDLDASDGDAFGLIVQALKSDGSTRVLSTPSIVTLNNEEAEITIGSEVPFITGSFTSAANDAVNPFQTIERERVGILLRVQPQISDGSAVRLALEQESSQLVGTGQQLGTADVVTSISTITTNVMVDDGELLVLGGLIDNQSNRSGARVPILGSIPLIGNLFRERANNQEQTMLMMFIRPTIIRNPQEALDLSTRRFDYLRTYELQRGESEEEESPFSERLDEIRDNRP